MNKLSTLDQVTNQNSNNNFPFVLNQNSFMLSSSTPNLLNSIPMLNNFLTNANNIQALQNQLNQLPQAYFNVPNIGSNQSQQKSQNNSNETNNTNIASNVIHSNGIGSAGLASSALGGANNLNNSNNLSNNNFSLLQDQIRLENLLNMGNKLGGNPSALNLYQEQILGLQNQLTQTIKQENSNSDFMKDFCQQIMTIFTVHNKVLADWNEKSDLLMRHILLILEEIKELK